MVMNQTSKLRRGLYLSSALLLLSGGIAYPVFANHSTIVKAATTTKQAQSSQKIRFVDVNTHKILSTQELPIHDGSLSSSELKLPDGYKRTDDFKYNANSDQKDLHYDGDYWNVYVSKDPKQQIDHASSTVTMTITTTENGKTTTTTTTTTKDHGDTGKTTDQTDTDNDQQVDNNGKTVDDSSSASSDSGSSAKSSSNNQADINNESSDGSTAEEKNQHDQATQTSNAGGANNPSGQTAEEKNANDQKTQGNSASAPSTQAQATSQPTNGGNQNTSGKNAAQGALPQTGNALGYTGLGLGGLTTAAYLLLRRKLHIF